jgi:hypothetical protein
MNINNLSQFKKALTLGSVWETFYFDNAGAYASLGVRPVSIKQTNAVAFKTPSGTDSWLHYDKANMYSFNDGKVQVYTHRRRAGQDEKVLLLEYRLISK